MIEAGHAEDEALAIAVALREAVEQKKTAALVTPDRALARRVGAALKRWSIAAEDSAGLALADTPAGVFARLAAEAALDGLAPVTLLALLKHPLLRLSLHGTERAVAALERAVLRGPRPRRGSAGLAGAVDALRTQLEKFRRKEEVDLHASDPRIDLADGELAAAGELVRRLAAALAPLEGIGRETRPLSEIAARHRDVLAALSRDGKEEGAFAGPDGARLADALDELATSGAAGDFPVAPSDYVELFAAALARARGAPAAATRRARAHPRAARGAAHRERPRRARRTGRGNMAAGDANRRLAQPPDAQRARPRSAGAPHRIVRRTILLSCSARAK